MGAWGCRPQTAAADAEPVIGTAGARAPHERVSDADRGREADLLRHAFADGLLRVDEYDQSLSGVFAAGTVAELAAATAVVPGSWRAEQEALRATAARDAARHDRWRADMRRFAGVMALLVGIWLMTSVAAGQLLHPWPVWPALGWGLPLFAGRPRPRAPANTMTPWDLPSASRRT